MLMRSLLRAAILFVLVFAGVNMALIMLGEQRPPNPMLVGFVEGCKASEKPCWYGIVLGVTSISEARQRLLTAGYDAGIIDDTFHYQYFYSRKLVPGCVKLGYSQGETTLNYLHLYCIGTVSIGDIATSLGMPESVILRNSIHGGSAYLSSAENGDSNITIGVGLDWKSVYSPIASIDLFQVNTLNKLQAIVWRWRGFVPMWRYCQLVPSYPRCV